MNELTGTSIDTVLQLVHSKHQVKFKFLFGELDAKWHARSPTKVNYDSPKIKAMTDWCDEQGIHHLVNAKHLYEHKPSEPSLIKTTNSIFNSEIEVTFWFNTKEEATLFKLFHG